MFDWVLNIDHELFTYLNSFHTIWMDAIQYWISNKYIWIPFYIFLLVVIVYHYKKKSIVIFFMVAGLVTASDQSSQFFKYEVGRYRPCRPESNHQPKPHTVYEHCGGKYSFYSAHASNSFAIANFLGFLLIPAIRHVRKILLVWAFIVSYSRIYLGVHYPSDIVIGALSGLFYGWLFWKAYIYLDRRLSSEKTSV